MRKRSIDKDDSIFECSSVKGTDTLIRYYGNYPKSRSLEKQKRKLIKERINKKLKNGSNGAILEEASFDKEDYLTIFKFDTDHLEKCARKDRSVNFPKYRDSRYNETFRREKFRLKKLNISGGFPKDERLYPISLLKSIFDEELE